MTITEAPNKKEIEALREKFLRLCRDGDLNVADWMSDDQIRLIIASIETDSLKYQLRKFAK